jgi:hypothetical protein
MMKFAFGRQTVSVGAAVAFLAGCGGANSSVPAVSANAAAFTHHEVFAYTGSAQTFTVPNGVKRIRVDALGGNGGSGEYGSQAGAGGDGGRVVATLKVYPQEALSVYVGGNGSGLAGGFNGGATGGVGAISGSALDGGGGGGASDVRPQGYPLSGRILVAGGGGGGGGFQQLRRDGSNAGGDGGGLVGDRGRGPSRCRERGRNHYRLDNCGFGGTGGTQRAGGSGGMSGTHNCYYGKGQLCGVAGTQGVGGGGGNGGTSGGSGQAGGGGGGGGGYFGGGGGGGGAYVPCCAGPGGGGGGGSSYVWAARASGVKMWKGWKAAQRIVTIYW